MYRISVVLSSILLIVVTLSCKNDDETLELPEPVAITLDADEATVVASANNFTFDLMAAIEKEKPNENFFISSFSIHSVLSMVMNGASEDAQEGFIETLGLSGMSVDSINTSYQSLTEAIYSLDPSITLNIANSNWYSDEYTIDDGFADVLTTYYDSELFERDFGSKTTLDDLNGWVETETNGKIKNILDQISPDEAMFLINAIYFKANWTTQFDKDATTNFPFILTNGQSVDVPMMVSEVKHWWAYDNTLNAQVIEIPYGNENYALTILLPDDASEINNLTAKIEIDELNGTLADSTTFVRDLYLPKFQLDFKTDLLDALVSMGMPLNELTNLFEETVPLKISQVIHQSFLEVNEEGSEAAAATVVGIEVTSLPASTIVNQPFVFLIRERNSGTILFSGKLLDPR
ncbi:MAG: serpin family protein [Bacteroidota bacterium]